MYMAATRREMEEGRATSLKGDETRRGVRKLGYVGCLEYHEKTTS